MTNRFLRMVYLLKATLFLNKLLFENLYRLSQIGLYWGTALQMWKELYNSGTMRANILSTHESGSEIDSRNYMFGCPRHHNKVAGRFHWPLFTDWARRLWRSLHASYDATMLQLRYPRYAAIVTFWEEHWNVAISIAIYSKRDLACTNTQPNHDQLFDPVCAALVWVTCV